MALDWLKTILGDAYSEDIDKKVSSEIGKAFVARSDFNALSDTKKSLETQIGERDKQLDELKKVDAAGLQAEIARLQGENTKAKSDFDVQLKGIKLKAALEARLAKEKAVDVTAVSALLDHSKISLDGENLIGIDDQIKALRDSKKWAFESSDVPGAGGNPPPGGDPGKTPLPKGTVIF
jgi:hypothetical protein